MTILQDKPQIKARPPIKTKGFSSPLV